MARTRSPRKIASSTSCVMNSTVRRWRCQTSSSQRCITARVRASSAPNGSSSSISSRSNRKVRIRATRWRIPPESWCGCWSPKPARPNSGSMARARARATARFVPSISWARMALSTTVRQGSSRSRCGMKDTRPSSSAAWQPRPLKRISPPSSGSSSPATMLNSVLLPQPDGPTTVTNSPSAASSDRPRRALVVPKVLLTARNSSRGLDGGKGEVASVMSAITQQALCQHVPGLASGMQSV